MRPWTPLTLVAFYATFVLGSNNINVPAGAATLQVTAGQPYTLTWSDASGGTVTIKLQQAPDITPDSGYVLASGIEASSESATFTIPATANSHQYTIEIIDDTDPTNYNFSPNFAVSGATGTQTAVLPGVTVSSASGAATSTLTTSAFTSSVSSNSASATSASSASSASASSASSASASISSAASSSQSAAAASSTVPSSNGAVPMKVPGGILAVLLGGAALL